MLLYWINLIATISFQFLPVVEGSGIGQQEKLQFERVLNKLLAQSSHEIVDVNKVGHMQNFLWKQDVF